MALDGGRWAWSLLINLSRPIALFYLTSFYWRFERKSRWEVIFFLWGERLRAESWDACAKQKTCPFQLFAIFSKFALWATCHRQDSLLRLRWFIPYICPCFFMPMPMDLSHEVELTVTVRLTSWFSIHFQIIAAPRVEDREKDIFTKRRARSGTGKPLLDFAKWSRSPGRDFVFFRLYELVSILDCIGIWYFCVWNWECDSASWRASHGRFEASPAVEIKSIVGDVAAELTCLSLLHIVAQVD